MAACVRDGDWLVHERIDSVCEPEADEVTIVHHKLTACWICGTVPTMIADEHGYSVIHGCINMSSRGVLNEPTEERAAEQWESMNRE